MKLLLDLNLSRGWIAPLRAEGHEVVQWRDVGDPTADDPEIMEYAVRHDCMVPTHDLDFGTLLATTGASCPSVLQLRYADLPVAVLAGAVIRALRDEASALAEGALITVDVHRWRLKSLPLER